MPRVLLLGALAVVLLAGDVAGEEDKLIATL
jgi:hypothetical protein